ncbi:hypothetical protein DEU56DRAFT_526745 [Suillus clintonianus]|uniref:uncharacterized protein n=1 Tax=Suillus clintonianus TaxID=1904413 RepID=UPI001B882910|nr:uncharacterized protein DEU56DRAFT_526745 [Suillus clintonianus]KAG2127680.1 hypothetical protein DEU56DRAFT_526745 [Suillus clintonianus]
MASSLHASTVPYPLHISGLSVDFSKSAKNVESAQVRIGKSHAPVERATGKTLQLIFYPPMKLSIEDSFSLHVRHSTWFRMKTVGIQFDTEDIFRVFGASGELETREYTKVHKNFTVIVELSRNTATEVLAGSSSGGSQELQPTTDEIIRICPRFRILVIGNTGVGKTSLINHAFGVENATASHNKPGEATIDNEFISPQNNRFVLHDSKGFEPGGEDNFKTVQDFIDRRGKMPDLKNQLHAVWLCFEIPRAGGRLLETGTEAFLTLKRDGKLGKIPIVVVLTKYDMLLDRVDRTLHHSSIGRLSEDDVNKLIKTTADAELQDVCIGPLKKFAGPDIPHATISTEDCHKETLACLIRMTENCVRQHVATEASVMTSMAQRVDPGLNIQASIEVGKKKYWKALASSTIFKDHSMWDCLRVLHTDIVAVWNFNDPRGYLYSPEFRTLMANMVNELDVGPTADPTRNIAFGLSIVGTISGILSALAGPAAPIVVPIVASIVIANWVYEAYQRSCAALQRFMKYIIDLTLVLQTLYLVSENQELTRRTIKLAIKSYHESPTSRAVHARIQEYDRQSTFLERADRGSLDRFVQLIQSYSISREEMSGLRVDIPVVGSLPDEPWEDEKT